MTDRRLVLAVPALGLAAGLLGWAPAHLIATLPVLAVLLRDMARSLRGGEFGLDAIAALAMAVAAAMGEGLAANLVALMYAGGQFLEDHARQRAGAEMTALLARQPRTALRRAGDAIAEVPLADLRPGDRLLIPRGATLPVDGTLASPTALLDTAAVTGEPMPHRAALGEPLLSGCTNAGDAFEMCATTDAQASTYAGIMRLVAAAGAARAPMARLADRWALGFLAATLLLSGAAWLLSGDPRRALGVLVVATPCPLILAVPVALMAGLSRAAALGLLVKSPAGIEALARIRVLVLDKTGTLTRGVPRVMGEPDPEALRLAASLDQASTHPVAQALVAAARERGLALEPPAGISEQPGEGVRGTVAGRRVLVGGPAWISAETGLPCPAPDLAPGATAVAVAVDGRPTGPFQIFDPLRPEAAATLAALRRQGVRRILLASGDAEAPVAAAAAALGVEEAHARLTPEGKVALVRAARAHGPVLMLGDGINDAPALAAADLGLAVGVRGAAAAQAADAVLLGEGLGRLPLAMAAAQRALRIARQSVAAGVGLSGLGMVAAALGWLEPVEGAVLQEGIDVAVILNALRARQG